MKWTNKIKQRDDEISVKILTYFRDIQRFATLILCL